MIRTLAAESMRKSAPCSPFAGTNLFSLVADLQRQEQPCDCYDPWFVRPWIDLAGLAVVAVSGELDSNCESKIHSKTQERLDELFGPRTPYYWDDLLHSAQVLQLLAPKGQTYRVHCAESELLGATQREVFPAMCAVWLKRPASIATDGLQLGGQQQDAIRLEFLRLLHLLEAERWYPYQTLGLLLQTAGERTGVDVGQPTEELVAALAERVLTVMGAVNINLERDHYMLHAGLQIPPLSPDLAVNHDMKVMAFRAAVREKLNMNQSWRRVATGLLRCIELRRERDPYQECLRSLDKEGCLLETDARIPFKDCLFLARLGTLVRARNIARARNHPGQFVFRLDTDSIRKQVREGLPVQEIASFLQERCEQESYQHFITLLRHSFPKEILP